MAGIGRIEEKLKNKLQLTDKNISVAFQDLNQLMNKAQQMAVLSRSIASKLKEHGSQVTNDETVLFKSYLMELGIEQQVDLGTSAGSSKQSYQIDLAKKIESVVIPVMRDFKKDQITLSDAYCIFNRAKGVDLVSPHDITEACNHLTELKLVRYPSGLVVLQSKWFNEDSYRQQLLKLVEENTFLTAVKLSQIQCLPIQLAHHRLSQCEETGLLCRDISVEGLRFYPNYLLNPKDVSCLKKECSSS